MMIRTLVAAAALGLAALPAVAQPSDVGNMAYPNAGQTPAGNINRGAAATRAPASAYARRPASRTPTDVGNMAFPDPSQTPAGDLRSVPVSR